MDLKKILNEIESQAFKEIAQAIIQATSGVENGTMPIEHGRLRISGCKHLLQIMALEEVKRKTGSFQIPSHEQENQ